MDRIFILIDYIYIYIYRKNPFYPREKLLPHSKNHFEYVCIPIYHLEYVHISKIKFIKVIRVCMCMWTLYYVIAKLCKKDVNKFILKNSFHGIFMYLFKLFT
jgi:hypothetical protein